MLEAERDEERHILGAKDGIQQIQLKLVLLPLALRRAGAPASPTKAAAKAAPKSAPAASGAEELRRPLAPSLSAASFALAAHSELALHRIS